jgi:hypothetical protein
LLQRWGALSMGIMFVHKDLPGLPGFKYVEARGELPTFLLLILLSWWVSNELSRHSLTRALLLGSEKDFNLLRGHTPSLSKTLHSPGELQKTDTSMKEDAPTAIG